VAPTQTYGGEAPTPGSSVFDFTVTFSDATTGINTSTIGTGDLSVTGPNGYTATATLQSLDNNANGSPRVATYRIAAPGGSWNLSDDGTYTITLNANQVSDVAGNSMAAQTVQSLNVSVPFAYKVGSQLRVDFDGTATPIVLASADGGAIDATRNGTTLSFTGALGILITGTSGNDTLGWSGPITLGTTINWNGGDDTFSVEGTAGYTFATDVRTWNNAGTMGIKIAPGSAATFDVSQHLRSLEIGDGGKATVAVGGNKYLQTSALSINGAGALDLNDNDLLVAYASVSPCTTVQQWVAGGYSGTVDSTKSGIVSTAGQNGGGVKVLAGSGRVAAGQREYCGGEYGDWHIRVLGRLQSGRADQRG
jgi:hypothetical protein